MWNHKRTYPGILDYVYKVSVYLVAIGEYIEPDTLTWRNFAMTSGMPSCAWINK